MATVRSPSAIAGRGRSDLVHRRDERVEVVLDGVEVAVIGVRNRRRNIALADMVHILCGHVQRPDNRLENRVHAAHNLRIRALELVRFAALGKLSFLGCSGQAPKFLLQALQHDCHIVDRLLHLLVVALVGLRDQLIDLAGGDLRENAVAFRDRKQDRIQHGVHAQNDLGVCALELLRLAALAELAFLRRIGKTH